ncbi:MAG: alcohol dehydrogenase catalytic domain-containing protein [Sphingomonas sp.]
MRAAVFEGVGTPLAVTERPAPEPGPGEVVLRVERCGICASDLHMTANPHFHAPPGSVLGHEIAGEVVECGAGVDRLRRGDRVAVLPIGSCGACAACLSGQPSWCAAMELQGGGYAEYLRIDQRQCLRLPAALSAEDGALVEPLAVALHGVAMAELPPGARVMVLGAGPIGLGVAYWAKRLGAARVGITASSRQREAMALAMGADAFVEPGENQSEAVVEALGGAPDAVFECVGQPGMIARGIDLVRPRGTVVGLGLCTAMDHFMPIAATLKQARIQMAAFYGMRDFEIAADTLDAGHVAPRAMITSRVTLDELPASFEALRSRSAQCKVMVAPSAAG